MPASQMGIRPFGSGSSDEDPYSVAGSGSSGSSGNNNRGGSKGSSPPADRPPKLPPRDTTTIYGASIWSRPLESQLRYNAEKVPGQQGGHNSRKDGNNNSKQSKSKRSTGGNQLIFYFDRHKNNGNFFRWSLLLWTKGTHTKLCQEEKEEFDRF